MGNNQLLKTTQVMFGLKGLCSNTVKNEDFLKLATGNFSKQCLEGYEKAFPTESKGELELNMKVITALENVENNGLKIDLEHLYNDHYKPLEERLGIIKSEKKFSEILGKAVSWREITVELQKLNYSIKNFEDLDDPRHSDDDFIKLIKEMRSLEKKLDQFERVRACSSKHGLVNTTFTPYTGISGRVVSHSPSTQNFPNYWKNYILPMEEGQKVYELDIKSADIIAMAYLSKEEKVYSLMKENRDFYKYVASKIFKQNEASVSDKVRNAIKVIANGVTYGMTGYSIAKELNGSGETKRNVSKDQGDQIRNEYFKLFPRFQKYQMEATEATTLSTLTGHMISVEANYKNVAFGPQNFIATIMKQILIVLEEKDLIKYVINVVHDSIWISCSQGKLEEAKQVMENALLGFFTEFAFDDIDFIRVKELGGGK